MKRMTLLDIDTVRYRVAFAAQHTYYDILLEGYLQYVAESAKARDEWLAGHADLGVEFEVQPRIEAEPESHCLQSLKLTMESILDICGGTFMGFQSGHTRDNWRTAIYPEYKATRPPRKPIHDAACRDYLLRKYKVETLKDLEADDRIAMLASQHESIVVSNDKDLDQIPGEHYNWVKQESYSVSANDAERFLACQTLAGDSTDNIKGINGIGMKTAEKLLSETEHNNLLEKVQWIYEERVGPNWRPEYLLTKALVTLPRSLAERDKLVGDYTDAKKAKEEMETAEREGEGNPRAGDADGPERMDAPQGDRGVAPDRLPDALQDPQEGVQEERAQYGRGSKRRYAEVG